MVFANFVFIGASQLSLPSSPFYSGDYPVPVTGVKTNGFIGTIGGNFTTDVTWNSTGGSSLSYLVEYTTGDPALNTTVQTLTLFILNKLIFLGVEFL